MYNDIVDLRAFYDAPLGQVVRRLMRRRLREIWGSVSGCRMLGIGYTTPFMRPFMNEALCSVNAMPAAQGVTFWPDAGPGCVTLCEESELPFQAETFDRVLIVHGVECTGKLDAMMREVWRVMTGNGRLLLVVPNRTGLWARAEGTPFGCGHPYSFSQINQLLRDVKFMPERQTGALYMPPFRSRMMLRSAVAWENVGQSWLPSGLSGVAVIEASKQVYALTGTPARAKRPRPFLVPVPTPSAPGRVMTGS